MKTEEVVFLEEMLYEAIYVAHGVKNSHILQFIMQNYFRISQILASNRMIFV